MVERQTGHLVRVLRTDNGGEYKTNQVWAYCEEVGILHQLTRPHTPQQNRTMVEAARFMLAAANLPTQFSGEAIATATYLQNIVALHREHHVIPHMNCGLPFVGLDTI